MPLSYGATRHPPGASHGVSDDPRPHLRRHPSRQALGLFAHRATPKVEKITMRITLEQAFKGAPPP